MRDLRASLPRRTAADAELPPVVGTFLRGLSIGALVGAAIAGSVILQRRRGRPSGGPASAPADERRPPPS